MAEAEAGGQSQDFTAMLLAAPGGNDVSSSMLSLQDTTLNRESSATTLGTDDHLALGSFGAIHSDENTEELLNIPEVNGDDVHGYGTVSGTSDNGSLMGYPPQHSHLLSLHGHHLTHQHQHAMLHPQMHHHLENLEGLPHHMGVPAGDLHLQHHDMGGLHQQLTAELGFAPSHKVCSKCRVTKEPTDFFKDKSKPDGLYSQCKTCAASEEKRRRESRAQQPRTTALKKCTRCGVDKDTKEYCQNKRSGDGLYSQCRKCVADKDRDRRHKTMQSKPDVVPEKTCSRCNLTKQSSDYYKDASKPDGLQTYCKPCLCAKHKEHRERKRQKIGDGASVSPGEVQPQVADSVKEDQSASQAPGYQHPPMMQSGVAPGFGSPTMEPNYATQDPHLMAQEQALAAHHQIHHLQGQLSPSMHPLGPPIHSMHPNMMTGSPLSHAMVQDPHHMYPPALMMQGSPQGHGVPTHPQLEMQGHLQSPPHHIPHPQEGAVLQHSPHDGRGQGHIMGQHLPHDPHSHSHFMSQHFHPDLQPQVHSMADAHAVRSQEHGGMQIPSEGHHQNMLHHLGQHLPPSSGVHMPDVSQIGVPGSQQEQMGFHHSPMQPSMLPHMHPGMQHPVVSSGLGVLSSGPPGTDGHAHHSPYAVHSCGLTVPPPPQSAPGAHSTGGVEGVGNTMMPPHGATVSTEMGLAGHGLAVDREQNGQGLPNGGEIGLPGMAFQASAPMAVPQAAAVPHSMGPPSMGYMQAPHSLGMPNMIGHYDMSGFGCEGVDALGLPRASPPALPVARTQLGTDNLCQQSSGSGFPSLPVAMTQDLGEQSVASQPPVSCAGQAHSQMLDSRVIPGAVKQEDSSRSYLGGDVGPGLAELSLPQISEPLPVPTTAQPVYFPSQM